MIFDEGFAAEFAKFPREAQTALLARARVPEAFGPELGRPHVDTLKGSKHTNMKELRFDAAGGAWRAAFAFDALRQAVILVAGKKSGGSQARFYRVLIATADKRFDAHLAQQEKADGHMARTLNDMIAESPLDQQREVAAQASRLIEEEMTLRDLRKAHSLTQKRMAEVLHISQDGVSRIEKRSDYLLSTLRSYIEAVGGKLRLVVEFPDRKPITLADLDSLTAQEKPALRERKSSGKPASA